MFFSLFNSKHKIADTHILSNYTDYHCHLLPGVDDGVKTADVTLQLLDLMQQQGVREVWFTPHIMEDIPNRPDDLRQRFQQFQGFMENPQPSTLNLHLAAEHMLDSCFHLDSAKQLRLPHNQLLVETSYLSPPYNLKQQLKTILQEGIFPLLAHPCRYNYMQLDDYDQLHDMGVHFQLNLPALTGLYGPIAKKKAEWILSKGYYSVTGTDTHSLKAYQTFLESDISSKTLKLLQQVISGF